MPPRQSNQVGQKTTGTNRIAILKNWANPRRLLKEEKLHLPGRSGTMNECVTARRMLQCSGELYPSPPGNPSNFGDYVIGSVRKLWQIAEKIEKSNSQGLT